MVIKVISVGTEGSQLTATEIAAVFDAARPDFANVAPRLWNPLGKILVAYSQPRTGERVLDAFCGAGASALPAARAVGLSGHVDAVDLADTLLQEGRAAALDVPQVRFIRADVSDLRPGEGHYDLVQSGFGVFFLPDMHAGSKALLDLLRDGGRFAVQTWRQRALVHFAECLLEAVRAESSQPPSMPEASASQCIDTIGKLYHWLVALGLVDVRVTEIPFHPPLTPELAWSLVLGSGFRALLDPLDSDAVARVRTGLLRRIQHRRLGALDASCLVGTGTLGPCR
jgi:ubiquinone/menaquinone biosynthesis C-methylase UbiE